MRWILDGDKPVRVEICGDYIYLDGDLYPHQEEIIYRSRQQARDARRRPKTIDSWLRDIAEALFLDHEDPVDIEARILGCVREVVQNGIKSRGQANELLARETILSSLLEVDVEDIHDEVADYVAGRRSQSREIDGLKRARGAAESQARDLADSQQRLMADVVDLTTKLGQARKEIWALELKAEALHCHQVMLAAERASLRKALKERS